jgi:hypothetical protein
MIFYNSAPENPPSSLFNGGRYFCQQKNFGSYPLWLTLLLFNELKYEALRNRSLQHQACYTNILLLLYHVISACSAPIIFYFIISKSGFVCRIKHPT